MTSDSLTDARWWRDQPVLRRMVADLLAGEMALMRPGVRLLAQPWPMALDLRADLGADSLDLMGLATALETVLRLHHRPPADAGAASPASTRLHDWVAAARSALDADGSALTFRTSGSSGAPKPCTHALAALWQETLELAALFPGRRRIVSLVPSHHIYGFLFTVLLPRRLGLGAEDVADLRGQAPGALAAQLRPGDLVVGFPDSWRGFSEQAGTAIPGDIIGVTSTAPCPDHVARGVLDAGLARLVQVYGSSETAGVGWRDRADGDYTLFGYWRRAQEADRLERSMPDGQHQSYPLQDRLDWSDAQHFRPAGRVDQAVQVGGINVFPHYVTDVLKLHPQVADASVRLMRADEGHRLKAFVVPRQIDAALPDAARAGTLRTELHAWLGERLSAAECPAAISFGAALPRGASGKLADWIIDACL
ncbi:AMP-binding protein [Massilia sp.]|uniref:AMP-binding protein n=1 Tax=Massilia sp. TaxID=1882437 RepID=UPI00289981BB|nr:AMP-binding protein [Massilia sp.]